MLKWNTIGFMDFGDAQVVSYEAQYEDFTVKKEVITPIVSDGLYGVPVFYYSVAGNDRVFNDFAELADYLKGE